MPLCLVPIVTYQCITIQCLKKKKKKKEHNTFCSPIIIEPCNLSTWALDVLKIKNCSLKFEHNRLNIDRTMACQIKNPQTSIYNVYCRMPFVLVWLSWSWYRLIFLQKIEKTIKIVYQCYKTEKNLSSYCTYRKLRKHNLMFRSYCTVALKKSCEIAFYLF